MKVFGRCTVRSVLSSGTIAEMELRKADAKKRKIKRAEKTKQKKINKNKNNNSVLIFLTPSTRHLPNYE